MSGKHSRRRIWRIGKSRPPEMHFVVLFALIEIHVDAAMVTGDLAFDGSESILDGADTVTKLGDVSPHLLEALHNNKRKLFDRVDLFL